MSVAPDGFAFRPVQVGRGFDKIVTSLRGAIVRGDLGPGDRLPSEPDLAVQLGVSRPMLREALKALEVSGYLEVRRGYGGGRFVSAPEPEEFHTIRAAPLSTMDVDAGHVMDVRLAIEPMSARLAAQTRDTADLGRALRQLGRSGSRPARIVEAVVQFHGALIEASGNPVFVAVYAGLRGPIALALGARVQNAAWRSASRQRLDQLVHLIETGDPAAAERATHGYLVEFEDERHEAEAAQR